ncbi:MAG: sensor histidine kinase [Chloroflexota bacterium]
MTALRWQILTPVALAGITGLAGWLTGYPGYGISLGVLLGLALAIVFIRRVDRQLQDAQVLLSAERSEQDVVRAQPDSIEDLNQSIARFIEEEREQSILEQSEAQRQSRLLDRMSDGVMRVDDRGIVVYANLAASTMFGGRTPIGRSFIAVVRDHELSELLDECLESGREFQRTMDLQNERRVINAVMVRLEANPPEVLVVLRDVTELTRLQTLRRDFVANVSHELRTPLSTIKILNETLLDITPEGSEEHRFLVKVESEVDSMIDLVNDLMQLARLESSRGDLTFEDAALGDLVTDVRERMLPIADRQSVTLEVDVEDPGARITADARKLRQALMNLVHNAIVHTDAGGVVRIECRSDDEVVRFGVIDTGKGIAPEDLNRIWERFYKADRSRAAPGTGLGLAIVKHIALAHGGDVHARSEPGVGSEFWIAIPRTARVHDSDLVPAPN